MTFLGAEALKERIREFKGKDMLVEEFRAVLKERLTTTNIEDVKTDVRPFLKMTLANWMFGRTITPCNWRTESCLKNNTYQTR